MSNNKSTTDNIELSNLSFISIIENFYIYLDLKVIKSYEQYIR